jgi:hypothetical protein
MTHRTSRRLVLAAAALALAGTGITAHAEDTPGLSDIAVISGCANTLPAVPAVGGDGGSFNSGACTNLFAGVPDVCLGIYSDAPATPGLPELAETCSVDFNGTYTNIVCGTGTAQGQATVISASDSEVVPLQIVFVAGQGVLTGTSPSEAGFVDQWVGVVDILPTNGSCPVPQFRYTAAVVAVDVPG